MLEGFLILYHPDSDRRLWILTKSADLPLKTEALAGLPVKCRNTAGGDFHPAPRTSFKKILDCRKNSAKKIHKVPESSKQCTVSQYTFMHRLSSPKKNQPLLYIETSFFFINAGELFVATLALFLLKDILS